MLPGRDRLPLACMTKVQRSPEASTVLISPFSEEREIDMLEPSHFHVARNELFDALRKVIIQSRCQTLLALASLSRFDLAASP